MGDALLFRPPQGYRSEDDDAPVKLASFEYNVHGAQTQTFERTHAKNDAVSRWCLPALAAC